MRKFVSNYFLKLPIQFKPTPPNKCQLIEVATEKYARLDADLLICFCKFIETTNL